MKKAMLILVVAVSVIFTSCSENYAKGERIGVITQFSQAGIWYKSWEGHLNVTQTGMNSSIPFDFSIDNDKEPDGIVATIDSAAQHGWKVKLIYHEVSGFNWFSNRGETDHFVTSVEVLEKNFGNVFNGKPESPIKNSGRTIDTIYVVIDRSK